MPVRQPPAELVTVSSQSYLPGTQVMLHSFLRHNPWFEGHITVLHDDLAPEDMATLLAQFPTIRFAGPSASLANAVDRLAEQFPQLEGRKRRFLSLEAFHPERSDTTLFCDSDLLFLSDISAMLDNAGPLIACGDRAQIEGSGRDPVSMEEGADTASTSFNAGLMVIDGSMKTQANWQQLLGHLEPGAWQSVTSNHTDQAVFNRQFANQITLADPVFNYLVGHAGKLRSAMNSRMKDAKVLHYNGPAKPWNFSTHLYAAAADASFVKAAQQWFDAYAAFLSFHHFAAKPQQ